MLRKPDIESAADESTVATLVEDRIWRERHPLQRHDVPRLHREGTGLLDMESLQDRDLEFLRADDQ